MASTYSALLRLELMADGENDGTWGSKMVTQLQLIERAMHGLVSKSMASGDVTLTTANGSDDEGRYGMIKATGTLTANRKITIPAVAHRYVVWNATSAAYALTIGVSGGVAATIPQGRRCEVICDGTDTYLLHDGGKHTFAGSTGVLSLSVAAMIEKITNSATAATGTINFDVTTQGILYYTSNASANWTLNVRGDASNSLDSLMATGEAITISFAVTQGGTAYYQSAMTIDGNSVTPKWLGGSAPSAGNASSIDLYTLTIVKTGSAAFTVFASQSKFA